MSSPFFILMIAIKILKSQFSYKTLFITEQCTKITTFSTLKLDWQLHSAAVWTYIKYLPCVCYFSFRAHKIYRLICVSLCVSFISLPSSTSLSRCPFTVSPPLSCCPPVHLYLSYWWLLGHLNFGLCSLSGGHRRALISPRQTGVFRAMGQGGQVFFQFDREEKLLFTVQFIDKAFTYSSI